LDFDDAVREAARRAQEATALTMKNFSLSNVVDEDDITGHLAGTLSAKLSGEIEGLTWDTKVLRHRSGKAGQEKAFGADLLLHVRFDTPERTYSKGVLVQSKRVEPSISMSLSEHVRLVQQCKVMLGHTPAAFVFDYTRKDMRVGAAVRIAGTNFRELYSECTLTSYRFFRLLFECPIGDSRITPQLVDSHLDLVRGADAAPIVVDISAKSSIERRRRR